MIERPKLFADDITLAAAKLLVPSVMEWLESDAEDYDEEEIAEHIVASARYGDDGFAIARGMDNRGYGADAALVEILDSMFFRRRNMHDKAVAAWVSAHAIVPSFSVGDRVSSVPNGEGTIVDIRRDQATYIIKFDADAKERGDGYIGTLVAYEDATKVEVAA